VRGSRVVIISLALNVFLIGSLVGGAIWIYVHTPQPGGSLQAAVEQLPQAQRDAFHQAMRAVRRDNHQTVLEGQQARREAGDLLKQPTLDVAALSAALERVRNADVALRTKLEQRIVEFAASSAAEVRQSLAEALVRRLPPLPAKKTP
jgi:uncharacterized membrane protein